MRKKFHNLKTTFFSSISRFPAGHRLLWVQRNRGYWSRRSPTVINSGVSRWDTDANKNARLCERDNDFCRYGRLQQRPLMEDGFILRPGLLKSAPINRHQTNPHAGKAASITAAASWWIWLAAITVVYLHGRQWLLSLWGNFRGVRKYSKDAFCAFF